MKRTRIVDYLFQIVDLFDHPPGTRLSLSNSRLSDSVPCLSVLKESEDSEPASEAAAESEEDEDVGSDAEVVGPANTIAHRTKKTYAQHAKWYDKVDMLSSHLVSSPPV